MELFEDCAGSLRALVFFFPPFFLHGSWGRGMKAQLLFEDKLLLLIDLSWLNSGLSC